MVRERRSSSAAVDLLVAFTAGAIFMVAEGPAPGMRWSWVLVVLSVVLAFAFAFPLFLLLRERVLAHRTTAIGTAAAVAP